MLWVLDRFWYFIFILVLGAVMDRIEVEWGLCNDFADRS